MLPPADSEIAAATFCLHLDQYWASRDWESRGWRRIEVDPLHVVVRVPGRLDGMSEWYFVRLGAEYYDLYPPTVRFVAPDEGWPRARAGTAWWPRISNPGWFQMHDEYSFPSGPGQLVCCSVTAEYYMSNHSPSEAQRWQPGRHTVAATLSRLAEVLGAPYYQGRDV